MKNKSWSDSLLHILVSITLLALLPACTTTPESGEARSFRVTFVPTGAIDDNITLTRTTIKRSLLNLDATQIMQSGRILKPSPLELVDIGKSLALVQLAAKLNVVAYVRNDGEGVLGAIKNDRAAYASGITLRRHIVYPDMESVVKDFPHVDAATLRHFIQTDGPRVELTKWEVSFYWIQSRDGKAFRLFMVNPTYLDHWYGEESEDSAATKKPFNALAIFSYRYPDQTEGRLHITSVIFDMTVSTSKGVYRGAGQSSGWLPLQLNSRNGPYSIQIGIIEASNFKSFFERIGGVSGIGGKLFDKLF